MKASITTKYGSPDVLQIGNIEKPVPKDNEVLVKIHAATITTAETMMRTGYPLIGRLYMGITKPKNKVSGTGFSGVIESNGNQVKLFKIGDEVFGESLVHFGTHAEYVCIQENGIISLKPDNVTHEEAAVVGDGHITSYNFLKKVANIKPDLHILINGASGSLGTSAVQLATYFGAEVTAVCSTRNLDLVRSLGADFVIDYTQQDFTENGKTYDIIYDTVGKSSFSKCKKSLTKKGVYISPILNFGDLLQMLWTSIFGNKKVLFSATGMLPVSIIRTFVEEIKVLMETGHLKSVIDKRYSLEQIPEAHRYIEKGHKRGNVVLCILGSCLSKI
ncbi:NAD(P)-dependent alcohol dehydrogenase [Aurantibacter crassamenti]|uniref:NAD(P)-dependent alcohol dehydrogenase n=1 Tax=Aurantibacter crassamenti TaxID=1837375 RepID=UPI00193AAAC2|nr:NAD(P)-dependent alcohol dehydrogenase [Aurantibacter crassamenti]MBM1105027.1 NAD(P)-dependent alcohol dehydrogenase [Aurantibacter crassamenti]